MYSTQSLRRRAEPFPRSPSLGSSGGPRSSVIIGARNEAQLRENLGAVGFALMPEQIKLLDEASDVMRAYPYYPYRIQEGFARINPPAV